MAPIEPEPSTQHRSAAHAADLSPAHETPRSAWAAALILFLSASVRVFAGFDPMPSWGTLPLDPSWIPTVTMTPAWFAVLDVIAVLGFAIATTTEPRGRGPSPLAAVGTLAILLGIAVIAAHSGVLLEHGITGGTWLASLSIGCGLAMTCRYRQIRDTLTAAILGMLVVLVAKAGWQVLVEFPATRASFEANREAILAAQGWGEDSGLARSYERRLAGNEASGWFGLSNVFATFMAAGLAAGVTLLGSWLVSLRDRKASATAGIWTLLPGAAAVVLVACSGIGVVLSQSKAGMAAAVIAGGTGCAGAMLQIWPKRTSRERALASLASLASLAGPALIALLIVLIVIRGLIGEQIGELSVLFRWFYISTAGEIFAAHPLLGVGPAGFRDAYMLTKPAMAPEDVISPHSVMFDWIATLGLVGVAWSIVLIGAAARCGRAVLVRSQEPAPPSAAEPAVSGSAIVLVMLASVMPGLFIQRPLMTPGFVGLLVVSLAIACGLAATLSSVFRRAPETLAGSLVGAAGLAVLLHAQFDVTLVWPSAAPLAAAMIGLGSSLGRAPNHPVALKPTPLLRRTNAGVGDAERPSKLPSWALTAAAILPAAAAGISAALLGWIIAADTLKWEQRLRHAATQAGVIREVDGFLATASDPDARPMVRSGAIEEARDLIAATATSAMPPASDAELDAWRAARIMEAIGSLELARRARPGDVPTTRSLCTLLLAASDIALEGSTSQREFRDRASKVAAELTSRRPTHSAGWAWRSVVATEIAARVGTQDSGSTAGGPRQFLIDAAAYREQAAALDPHGLTHPSSLVSLYGELGDTQARSQWAARALAINENLRLDRALQLGPEQAARFAAFASDAEQAPTEPAPAEPAPAGTPQADDDGGNTPP